MNLTNTFKPSLTFTEVESFSKYICQEDRYNLPPSQTSFNSQTLLIESTPINKKNSFCLSSAQSRKQSFILLKDKENMHYCDINEEFQITINDHSRDKNQNKSTRNIPLEDLCGYLIKTVKDLQFKIENLQNKQRINKKLSYLKDQASQKNQNVSFLNSTKQTEKQGSFKCQECSKYKDFMQLAVQNIENKTKGSVYKQQMEKTQKQLMKIQVLNEQYKKEIQKLKGQNNKFKQLIKQYQVYNKRSIEKNNQNLETNYFQLKNKENKVAETYKSLNYKNILQRENSLDQKLNEKQNQRYNKMKRLETKYYSPDAFRKIENSQIFTKQTPKTPQQLVFRKLKEDSQKTELKSKHRSCNGILKQIIQFEQKNERGIQNRLMEYDSPNKKIENRIKNKYLNNELLQRQLENKNNTVKHYMNLSNFQTMESLQEIIYKQQLMHKK